MRALTNGRVWGTLVAGIWLAYLVPAVWSTIHSTRPPLVVGANLLGAATFVGLYLSHWWWLFRPGGRLLAPAGCAAIAVLLVASGGYQAWGGTFVYVSVLVGAWSPWQRSIGAVTAVAATSAGFALLQHVPVGDSGYLVLVTLLAGVANIGVFQQVRANRELLMAREEIARLAVSEERLRFARDLHDLLGHSLSVIVLKAELASKMASRDPERAQAEASDIERVARDALREVRDAVAGYRQPALSQELDSARAVLEAAGIRVRLTPQAGALSTSLETTLAWAVREGVTNIIRHSRATQVSIDLARENGRVYLHIADDGQGGEAPPGNGLRGLGERLAARGGELRFGPGPQGGFRLAASLPLQETPRAEAAPA